MNTYDVIKAISQIVGEKGYDGAKNKDGSKVEIGLKREEGNPLLDKRVMDGFGVRFAANNLIISYQAEILLSDIYKGKLEDDVEAKIQEVADFIKKEFKKETGSALTLKPVDEAKVRAENTSRVRYFITAHRVYEIGSAKIDPIHGPSRDSIEASFKSYLESGKAPKPKNDTRPKPRAE
jgi:hypothetical protein